MKRYRLLEATEHNWGMLGRGDWTTVTWSVYSDRSYMIETKSNPTLEELRNSIDNSEMPKETSKFFSGEMDEAVCDVKPFVHLIPPL